MAISAANSLAPVFSVLYLCKPIAKVWDPTVEGTCGNRIVPFLTTAVFNVVTDVAILLLPIWLLAPLRINRRKKIGIMLTLMTGGLYVFPEIWQTMLTSTA
jgi:hypothetical protein